MRLSFVYFDSLFWVLVLLFSFRVVIFVLFKISCDMYEAAFSIHRLLSLWWLVKPDPGFVKSPHIGH